MKKVLVLEGSLRDVEAMQKLLQSHGHPAGAIGETAWEEKEENYYRGVFENAPVGIFRSTLEGELIRVNPALAAMLEYDSPEEMMCLQKGMFLPAGISLDRDEKGLRSGNGWKVFVEQLPCKGGDATTCNLFLRLVRNEMGGAELDGFVVDLGGRREIKEELRVTNEMFRAIINSVPTAIIGLDLEGRVQNVWNPAAESMFGWTAEEVMGKVLPTESDENEEEFRGFRRLIADGKTLNGVEVCRRRRDGTPIEYSIYASPLRDEEGGIAGNLAVLVDITERKRDEKRIRDSLAEKEVLLREIHHRVKNNLQVVSSLLYLQAQKIDDPVLAKHFIESQNRIYSMALAHDLLYQSKNLAEIHLPTYVRNLVGRIRQGFEKDAAGANCRVRVDEIKMDIDQIIPCGLLITELFSNALKHAFPNGQSGTVDIFLQQQNGTMGLTIDDDGVGLPKGMDFATAESLGLQLIRALTAQLNGTIEHEKGNGTRVRVAFPSKPG